MSRPCALPCPQCLTVLLLALASPATVAAQEEEAGPAFQWQDGPLEGTLGDHATLTIPEGYAFLDAAETQRLLEAMGNPTSGNELGTVVPASGVENWYLFFEFDDVGYVKDDEKDDLDADGLLDSIREGTEEANKERRRRGWTELHIQDWQMPPRYNETTHNLEWAVRGVSEEAVVFNHDIRLLGRNGVMEVGLVVSPEEYDVAVPQVDRLLEHFDFVSGSRYAEYRAGDKIAKYGLATLVAGGAAAVALKTGLFKKLGKVILLVVLAIGAFFKKLWAKITGKGGPAHERSD